MPRSADVIKTDVTNWDSVQAMVAEAERGLGKVDVLVNNVGWTHDKLFIEKPRGEWEREIQLNLWGNINCTRAVLDGMIQSPFRRGRQHRFRCRAHGGISRAAYGACKAAVIALSKSLAREAGRHGIRFNVVCPGATMAVSDEEIGEKSIWATVMREWNTPEMRERISKLYHCAVSGSLKTLQLRCCVCRPMRPPSLPARR